MLRKIPYFQMQLSWRGCSVGAVMRRCVLVCIWLGGLCCSSLVLAKAMPLTELTQAMVPAPATLLNNNGVIDTTAPVAQAAFHAALQQVLIKLTGNSAVMSLPTVREHFTKVMRWVKSYNLAPVSLGGGAENYLQVQFDSKALLQALRSTQQSIWNVSRPVTLVYLLRGEGKQLHVVTAATDPQLAQFLNFAAKIRGISIVLPTARSTPLINIAALAQLTNFALQPAELQRLQQVYTVDSVLVGQLTPPDDNFSDDLTQLEHSLSAQSAQAKAQPAAITPSAQPAQTAAMTLQPRPASVDASAWEVTKAKTTMLLEGLVSSAQAQSLTKVAASSAPSGHAVTAATPVMDIPGQELGQQSDQVSGEGSGQALAAAFTAPTHQPANITGTVASHAIQTHAVEQAPVLHRSVHTLAQAPSNASPQVPVQAPSQAPVVNSSSKQSSQLDATTVLKTPATAVTSAAGDTKTGATTSTTPAVPTVPTPPTATAAPAVSVAPTVTSRWWLSYSDETVGWTEPAMLMYPLIQQALVRTATMLANQAVQAITSGPIVAVAVNVQGIAKLGQYQHIANALLHLNIVTGVQLKQASAEGVVLTLQVRGGAPALLQVMQQPQQRPAQLRLSSTLTATASAGTTASPAQGSAKTGSGASVMTPPQATGCGADVCLQWQPRPVAVPPQ